MKIMHVNVKVGRVDTDATDVLVLLHCEGAGFSKDDAAPVDLALGGALTELLKSKEFEGKAGETALLHTHRKIPAKRVVLVGLGKTTSVGLDTIRQAMGHAVKRVRQAKAATFTVTVPAIV